MCIVGRAPIHCRSPAGSVTEAPRLRDHHVCVCARVRSIASKSSGVADDEPRGRNRVQLHLTPAAEVPEVTVTGTLPMGDTTGIVTYFVIDTTTNSVVGQVVLPNAVKKKTSVSMTVKVPNASASYQIGTFDEDGFHASSFLSVRNPTSTNVPPGPSEQDDGPLTCLLSLASRR